MRKILKVSIFILLLFFMAGCEFLPSGNNGKNYKKSFELAEEVGYTGSYDDWKILMSKYRDEDIIDVFIEDNNIFIVLDDGKNIKIGVDEDWIDISGGHEKPDEPENPGTEEPGNRPEEPVEIFYNITFDTGCDIVVPDQKVKNLSKITEPELPERDGYELEGWYYNDQKWSFVGYVVTEDMELVAKWTKTELSIRLLYNTIYGYCDVNSIKGKTGEIVELPDVTPNPGYQFLGWEDSKTGSVYSKYYNCGNDNISLVALFGYQVLLISDTVETVIDLNINDTFTLPEGNISNGKKCIGWYDITNNKIYKVGDTLSNKKPITLTALFEYNMIFETVDNGTVKKAMDGGYLDLFGTEIKESFNKYGENFIGWFDGKYSFAEITEYPFSFNGEDVILYEYKIKDNSFTITFDSNGGDDVSPIQFSSKFESFADEMLNTFNNSANGSLYVTINNFKETAYYLFDDVFCVKENLKKYSWLFELIKNDIVSSNDYDALNEYDKASYDIIINDLERLIANARKTYEIDFYYYDFETKNAICDYIYGILNKCLIIGYNFINRDYSKKENFDIFMSIVQTNEHINSFKNLPIPVKARHTFTGWYDVNGNLVEEVFDDITLIAGWEEMLLDVSIGEANGANIFVTNFVDDLFAGDTVSTINGAILTVGTDLFSSLDEAISMAGDNSIIYVGPGKYSLMHDINKNVIILGPHVDLGYPELNREEAIINVSFVDTGIALNCENIVFNGLNLKGFGGGAGVSGRMFRDGENLKSLTVKSCVISDANSVFVLQKTTNPYTVLIEDCYIHNIGQFVLWVAYGMTNADVKDCYIEGVSCGAIVNSNATLFRIRRGSLNAENNVFYGDPISIGGYFESNFELSYIEYNTFISVNKYFDINKSNFITFDKNLYLDWSHNTLPSPNDDIITYNSEEELKEAYANFKSSSSDNDSDYISKGDINISFDDASNRIFLYREQQVWYKDGMTVTNNKANGAYISDYIDPVRFYKGSNLTIECGEQFIEVVFNFGVRNYFSEAPLIDGANVTISSSKMVIKFIDPVTSFSIENLSAQMRVSSIEIYKYFDNNNDIEIDDAKAIEYHADYIIDGKVSGLEYQTAVMSTSGKVLYVGEDVFSDITEAYNLASDGEILFINSGEYSLTFYIDKNVTFLGANAGVAGKAERVAETVLNLKTIKVNADVTFDGLYLQGNSNGFSVGSNVDNLVITNCVVYGYNIFVVSSTTLAEGKEGNITLSNNQFECLGRSFVLVHGSNGIKEIKFIDNNTVAHEQYGGVESEIGMFSIRGTIELLTVQGNYFAKPSASEPTLFRLDGGASNISYNTFANIDSAKFISSTSVQPTLTFDKNLYLDEEGKALTTSPNGDTKVYASAEELAAAYANKDLVVEENPTVEEVRGQYVDKDVEVTVYGVVTAKIGNSYYVQDGDFAVMIYNHAGNTVKVGDKVAVTGTLTVYCGRYEVKNITNCEVVEAEFTAPVLELTNANYNATALAGKDSVLVSFKGVTYVSGKVTVGLSSNIIFKTLEGTEVVLRIDKYMDNTAIAALKAVVDELNEGDICDLQNLVLGWWNGPQLTPFAADSVIVVVKTSIV